MFLFDELLHSKPHRKQKNNKNQLQLLPGYGYFDIKDILMTFLGFFTVNIIFRMNEKYFCKAFE